MNNKNLPKFGTDGIRGEVGSELTPTFLVKLGYLIGQTLNQNAPILIGNDSRRSNSMVVSSLTAGLTCAGREIWELGLCTTPAVSSLIRKFNTAGGIMVSASHNPPEDNGIKIFDDNGLKINTKVQTFIESQLKTNEFTNDISKNNNDYGNSYYKNDILKYYRNELIASVTGRNLTGVNIVLDLCCGSTTAFGEDIFKELGANLIIINGTADGNLINVKCGSTHLDPLKEKVIETNADMGFAFDGDGDRMLAIDGEGRVIDGDHILYLWGKELQEANELPQERIVCTIMSNLGFEKAWKARGGILERTDVGDQNVHNEMLAKGATLGGEQSGHILSSKNGYCGDGLLTALQIATICHSKKMTLSQWRNQSFNPFPQKLINVPFPKSIAYKKIRDSKFIKEAVLKAEGALQSNGRVLIRASGTEPIIRIMVEASKQSDVNSWSNYLAKVVKEKIFNLSL